MKARRIASGVPYPQERAVCSTPSAVSSRRRRAVSSRNPSTWAGVMPTSAAEDEGELARGQVGLAGQGLHRQVGGRVVGDPALYVAQRLPVGQLPGELGAELGLVARTAQEHHQLPGDVERRVAAEVVFRQGQCRVDPQR